MTELAMNTARDILSGGTIVSCALAALFFVRFWRGTGDRFFAAFALAFALMGVERFVLATLGGGSEFRPYVYLVRLVAFLCIIAAIADKNRER